MKQILAFLLVAVPLFAQDQPRPTPPPDRTYERMRIGPGGTMAMLPAPRMGGTWWRNAELAKKLNLSDQQVQQMEQTYQQNRLKLIDQVAAVQKAEVTLEPMMAADKPDENQVLAQIDKIAQARAELEKSNARMLLGIRQVLTAEQWKQLKTEMPGPAMGPRPRRGNGGPGSPNRGFGRNGGPTPQGPAPAQPPQPE